MQYKKLTFRNRDGATLAARVDLPPREAPRAYALFAHCFTCSKDLKAAAYISRALTDHGLAVLRFDFTGLGESQGDFADTTFTTNVEDVQAAAALLAAEFEGPRILIGHSLGGAAVLQAAAGVPTARAVVTIGSPADPRHVLRRLEPVRDRIETRGEAEVELDGRPFRIKKQFLDDLEKNQAQPAIRRLGKALLVMHAPLDDTVEIDHAGRIFMAARHPKSFISLDGADHLLSRRKDAAYAGSLIAAWAERYI